jgi:hypothetical protein
MVYCHLLLIDNKFQVYSGFLLTCGTMQREFDYEALLIVRNHYQYTMAFNPDLPFTINMPTCFKDVQTLVLRTKPLTLPTFQGLLSYQVVPWSFDWLRSAAVVYEPSGMQQDDDLVINTICNGSLRTITWDHPYQRTRVDKVDDISMLKRITFKWDEHESIERPVLATELS